jgi:sugar-specific transcriptional regulator TrmB
MYNTLVGLGLTRADARVYIFLAAKIPQKAEDIADALRVKTQHLYPCLRNLQEKGIVNCTDEHPRHFFAVPVENILDLLVKANLEEAQSMEENRQKILSLWHAMTKKNSTH